MKGFVTGARWAVALGLVVLSGCASLGHQGVVLPAAVATVDRPGSGIVRYPVPMRDIRLMPSLRGAERRGE